MNYKELLGIPIIIKNHKIIPYEFLTVPKNSWEFLRIQKISYELTSIPMNYKELLRIPIIVKNH